MPYELLYTSAARGLLPGAAGFSTVKMSRGIPLPLREALESMSSYRHLYPPNDPRAAQNPVCTSLVHLTAGGKCWRVLSRIADAGVDHTHRTNFLAHHIAFGQGDTQSRDVLQLLTQADTFVTRWDGQVQELLVERPFSTNGSARSKGELWASRVGPGWLEFTAAEGLEGSNIYLAFHNEPSFPFVLEMLAEVPQSERWDLTFSTFYQKLPPAVRCNVRCLPAGDDELRRAESSKAVVIDLATPAGPAPGPRRRLSGASHAVASVSHGAALAQGSGGLALAPPKRQVFAPEPQRVQTLAVPPPHDEAPAARGFGLGMTIGMAVALLLATVIAVPLTIYQNNRFNDQVTLSKETAAQLRSTEEQLAKQAAAYADLNSRMTALREEVFASKAGARAAERELKSRLTALQTREIELQQERDTAKDAATKAKEAADEAEEKLKTATTQYREELKIQARRAQAAAAPPPPQQPQQITAPAPKQPTKKRLPEIARKGQDPKVPHEINVDGVKVESIALSGALEPLRVEYRVPFESWLRFPVKKTRGDTTAVAKVTYNPPNYQLVFEWTSPARDLSADEEEKLRSLLDNVQIEVQTEDGKKIIYPLTESAVSTGQEL